MFNPNWKKIYKYVCKMAKVDIDRLTIIIR